MSHLSPTFHKIWQVYFMLIFYYCKTYKAFYGFVLFHLMFSDSNNPLKIFCVFEPSWMYNELVKWKILNQNTCVLLFRSSLVRLRSNWSKLTVNTAKKSHTKGLLSIQTDKYETRHQMSWNCHPPCHHHLFVSQKFWWTTSVMIYDP